MAVLVYHGSSVVVESPGILKTKYAKDFSWGFYCTNSREQAVRWAARHTTGCVNRYWFTEHPGLKILRFPEMSDKWLDFIAHCRNGGTHSYDVVEGPMADDTIWNYVNDFLAGDIDRSAFWELAKFKHPTHQISFHTQNALRCIEFAGSEVVNE